MTSAWTRRGILAGIASGAGSIALGDAPATSLRPKARVLVSAKPKVVLAQSEQLIAKAKLSGDLGFAVADAKTGEVLEARLGETALPPASTLKVVTSLYALEKLGASHQFATRILLTGPVVNGRVDGDLVLVGGGDPTLDTDRLADLAVALREAGVQGVRGKFLVYGDALPRGDRIDYDQPEYVSYNPSYSGLNLNYNRVHFEWKRRNASDYDVTMHARAARFSPSTRVAQMSIVDRPSPVFAYQRGGKNDYWSVSRKALGKKGARWLPVRYPALYTADVFRTLARSNGIILGSSELVSKMPEGIEIARVQGGPLVEVLQGMLKYSTNLTAEVAGLSASDTYGPGLSSLVVSGGRMAGWARSKFGTMGVQFRDHSGLGYGSAMSPQDMVTILSANAGIAPLLKTVNLGIDKKRPAPEDVLVRAKTGTLNFVSALAGYVTPINGRPLAFAIFGADTARRDAIPPEARERPPGAKGWSRRSRTLQKELIRHWSARFT